MLGHKALEQLKDEKLKLIWKNKVQLSNKYGGYRKQFLHMLTEFQSMWDEHIGQVNIAKHCIELTLDNTQPICCAPYRARPNAREYENAEIEKMLTQNVIDPAQTKWAAQIIFAPRKDGLHFCVDCTKINADTRRDSYPIPRINECTESLEEATVSSTLDANSDYWQVEVEEINCDKTAFMSHYGLYRFLQMLLD